MPLSNHILKHLTPAISQLDTKNPSTFEANSHAKQASESSNSAFLGMQHLQRQDTKEATGPFPNLQCRSILRLPPLSTDTFPSLHRTLWQPEHVSTKNLNFGRFAALEKAQPYKQDKSAIIEGVKAQGHAVKHLLVTRRPQDFMFSQARYTSSGFCQGFVMSAFTDDMVFKGKIDETAVTQKAESAQHSYEGAFRFSGTDPKSHLYQQNGFQLGQSKNFSQTSGLIQHIQTQVQQKLSGDNPPQDKIFFDVHLSGGGRVDHATGIAIEKQPNGTFNAAVIDADRGYRRTLNTTDLNGFFQDLEKQSSGEKTKGGHNRKFHSWQNRHIVAREVKAAGSK